MTTRRELIEAIGARYRNVAPSEKKTILDGFVSLTGYHRKHATRVLGTAPRVEQKVPVRDRVYDEAVRQALIVLWEAGDRICGKRLKPLISVLITAMERHGHLDLNALVPSPLEPAENQSIARIDCVELPLGSGGLEARLLQSELSLTTLGMALAGTLLNGVNRGLDAYRPQQTQHFGANTLINANGAERYAFARCTVIDGSTAADVPAGVAILAGVAHMQFASTVSAAQ